MTTTRAARPLHWLPCSPWVRGAAFHSRPCTGRSAGCSVGGGAVWADQWDRLLHQLRMGARQTTFCERASLLYGWGVEGRAGVGGDVHRAAGRSVRPVTESGPGTWWQGVRLGSAVAAAAGRAGAAGGGVLPHEPGDRVPGDPKARPTARDRAGPRLPGRSRAAVDRGRHPGPGPRPQGRSLVPQLPVLGEHAGHRGRRDAPGGGHPARCPATRRTRKPGGTPAWPHTARV